MSSHRRPAIWFARVLAGALVGAVTGMIPALLFWWALNVPFLFIILISAAGVAFDRSIGGEPRKMAKAVTGRLEVLSRELIFCVLFSGREAIAHARFWALMGAIPGGFWGAFVTRSPRDWAVKWVLPWALGFGAVGLVLGLLDGFADARHALDVYARQELGGPSIATSYTDADA